MSISLQRVRKFLVSGLSLPHVNALHRLTETTVPLLPPDRRRQQNGPVVAAASNQHTGYLLTYSHIHINSTSKHWPRDLSSPL